VKRDRNEGKLAVQRLQDKGAAQRSARNRYPLALIPPLAYLLGLIIIITVITRYSKSLVPNVVSHVVSSPATEIDPAFHDRYSALRKRCVT